MKKLAFDQDIILENDIVLLRNLKEEDFDLLLPFSINEPTLWEYSLVPANSEELLKKYMAIAFQAQQQKTSYPFIVFDKRTQQYAGSTRFYDYQLQHNTVQLGYTWYGKDYQGTGLNKNCKYLMLSYAFEQLGLDRVEFRADSNNERSIAAMKSIGCTVEGILRNNCAKGGGGRRSSIILSILKTEWEQGAKDRLLEKIANENK